MNSLLNSTLISAIQKNRISKCHYQSIYLLEKTHTYNSIILKISGSTLNIYTLTIEGLNISCECPDSHNKSEILFCKHICFIICIVGKIYDDNIFVSRKLNEEYKSYIIFRIFNIVKDVNFLCDFLNEKYSNLKFKMIDDGEFSTNSRNIEDECSVCYNHMKESDVYTCSKCLNSVHKECFKRWLKDNNICIFCRSYINVSTNKNNSYLNISK